MILKYRGKGHLSLGTVTSMIYICQAAVGGGVDPGHCSLQRGGGRRAGQGDADTHTGAARPHCV